jgi:hypothetical protein
MPSYPPQTAEHIEALTHDPANRPKHRPKPRSIEPADYLDPVLIRRDPLKCMLLAIGVGDEDGLAAIKRHIEQDTAIA